MQINAAISQRIRQLCKEYKITPNRLAELSAIAPTTLKDALSGKVSKPNIVLIYKICRTLKISLSEFFNSEIFNKDFDD